MESPLAVVVPVPRLRLSRNGLPDDTPGAGSSVHRFTSTSAVQLNDGNNDDGDDDQHSTPRMTAAATIMAPEDTPAARLRALLSRVPISSKSPATPAPPSEVESDFDPPTEVPANTPSIARESLKDLFSHALREPGTTPQKNRSRWRRNSIDLSEVDTPRLQPGTGKNKGKRRSLSDEEVDSPSKSQRSESSFKSSQAMTFDMLRERLMTSRSQLKDQPFPDTLYDHAFPDIDDSESFLRNIVSPTSVPEAMSTPQQSLRMSFASSFPSQSNLLDQNSEMQRAIEDAGSYEHNTSHNGPAPAPSPSVNTQHRHSPSSSFRSKSTASSRPQASILTIRGSDEFRSSSRMSLSEMSTSSHDGQDQIQERERGWNKRKPLARSHTPELRQRHPHGMSSGDGSALTFKRTRSRRGSSASLNSSDDGLSGSSITFPTEHGQLSRETEKDHITGRERELKKGHSIHPRPTSSLDFHSPGPPQPRTNGLAHQTREGSSQFMMPLASPAHQLLRHHSFSNLSRPSSPASSSRSHDAREGSEEDIVYERERNWNAPRQKWSPHGHVLDSPSRAPSPSRLRVYPNGRTTTESLPRSRATKGEQPQTTSAASVADSSDTSSRPRVTASPGVRSTLFSGRASSSSTPFQQSTSRKQHEVHLSRSPSFHIEEESEISPPMPLSTVHDTAHTSSAAPSSSFVYLKHLSNRTPLELEKNKVTELELTNTGSPAHDRAIPSRAINNGHRQEEEFRVHEDVNESLPENRTPNVRTISPPSVEVPKIMPSWSLSASSTQKTPAYESELQKATSSSIDPTLNLDDASTSGLLGRPSSTPPSPQAVVHSVLSTPPRRSPFNSKHNFETPPPPEGMPQLPEPPSPSSEEDEQRQMSFTPPFKSGARPDFSSIKTPRPPGGWSSTPRQQHDEESEQRSSASDAGHENEPVPPLAPISGLSSMPTRTPAPPGAWMTTPAGRRPLQKVRFDTQHSHTEHSLAEQDPESSNLLEVNSQSSSQSNNSVLTQAPEGTLPNVMQNEESTLQSRRESSSTQASQRSNGFNTPRKSPSIRVVDAFGRVQQPADMSPDASTKAHSRTKRKTGVRVLDAMGRNVDSSEVSSSILNETASLNHTEALTRVRQGLSDLAQGLDDMDRTNHDPQVDARLHELDDTSRAARENRERLHSAETMARAKFEPLRANMKNGFPLSTPVNRRLYLITNSRIWWGLLLLQLIIVFIMYRISIVRARDIFLTTYYDPFYAELHLYTTRPDTLHRDMFSLSRTPWLSLVNTLRQEGWKASTGQLRDNIAITVGDWQRQLWENWGTDSSQRTLGWPPT